MKLKLRFKKKTGQLSLCSDNSRPDYWDQPFRWRHLQMLGKIFLKSAWKHLRTYKIMKNSWLKMRECWRQILKEGEPGIYDCFSAGCSCHFHSGAGCLRDLGGQRIQSSGPLKIGRVQCAPVTLCWAPKRQDHRSRVNQRLTGPSSSYI